MAEAKQRATRVEEQEFEIGTCPVCRQTIVGIVTVAIRLGPVQMKLGKTPDGLAAPNASVKVTAEPRSFAVKHMCVPDAAAAAQSGDAERTDPV